MFNINRTEIETENKITISTRDGYITVAGKGEFVTRMFKEICENSPEVLNELRKNLEGETVESIAEKMRETGFPEDVVSKFQNAEIDK